MLIIAQLIAPQKSGVNFETTEHRAKEMAVPVRRKPDNQSGLPGLFIARRNPLRERDYI
jgi:hypothetical protein